MEKINFNFIHNRYYFYFISLFLVIFGGFSFYFFNPRLGIDLVGGEILEVKTKTEVPLLINQLGIKVSYYRTENGFLIKGQGGLDKLWQEILAKDSQAQRLRFESVSSSLSSELRKRSGLMVILVLIAIGIYVASVFYKLKGYFSLFYLGMIVVVTLFHDVVGTMGVYVFLTKVFNFDLDIKFITALLIIAGFSVHDTIIVFDRLRENIIKQRKRDADIFDLSINQTIRRSIFTSLTAVLSILPLSFLVPELRGFLWAIQIGIIIGTYSSICLAAPLLYDSADLKTRK
ncbi:MAG: protein translocase subunit SecF [Candidatus Parcubacteria bacterium]|nr:MAG: protein translocase subunit SecF [Candidatus Parcubacteria bacterium]